jgi:hypothetical protein
MEVHIKDLTNMAAIAGVSPKRGLPRQKAMVRILVMSEIN